MRLLTGSSSSPTSCWIVIDGLRRSKGTDKVDGYFLANRSLPWWAVGLSVMATQMSAVTLVGTTGQAYSTGLRFIQFYFGLPLAMIILSLTVVPFFTRARVYTAYEYLERRFDVRDAVARELSVPDGPRVLARRDAGGAGGRDVGDSRLDAAGHGARDLRADDRLHDASAACRRWRGPTSSRCSSSSAACRRRSCILLYGILQRRRLRPGAAPGRRDRPAEGDRLHASTCARPTRSGRA